MLNPETIQKLLRSREGDELRQFISSQINALDRVSDIPDDWTEQQKATEVTARKRASQVLASILRPFLEYQEPATPSEDKESDIYYNHNVTK